VRRTRADARHFWSLSLVCLAAAIAVAFIWHKVSWSLPAGSLMFALMAVYRTRNPHAEEAQARPARQLSDEAAKATGPHGSDEASVLREDTSE
jgi:hypothetical protein